MFKLIHIKDSGMMIDIKGRGLVRTPIDKILLDEDQIRRIITLHNGPKHVFIMNPKNNVELKRATLQNYKLPYSEIFKTVELEAVEVVPDEDQTYTLDDVAEIATDVMVVEDVTTESSLVSEEVLTEEVQPVETEKNPKPNNNNQRYNNHNRYKYNNKKH